jgi:DNA-binding PucR family transcriptional regulator
MPGKPVRYADVALLSSMVQDDLLSASLRELYLLPLDDERGGGVTLRETLRAYFAAGRNGASAAAALNVSRQTITNRLQTVEARVGRSLVDCATTIEVALRLDELVTSEHA